MSLIHNMNLGTRKRNRLITAGLSDFFLEASLKDWWTTVGGLYYSTGAGLDIDNCDGGWSDSNAFVFEEFSERFTIELRINVIREHTNNMFKIGLFVGTSLDPNTVTLIVGDSWSQDPDYYVLAEYTNTHLKARTGYSSFAHTLKLRRDGNNYYHYLDGTLGHTEVVTDEVNALGISVRRYSSSYHLPHVEIEYFKYSEGLI